MPNSQLNIKKLREILLNPGYNGAFDEIFDDIVSGLYSEVFPAVIKLMAQDFILIDVAYGAIIARPDQFVNVLNYISICPVGDLDATYASRFHFACLIGVIKGVTYLNESRRLSRDEEKVFVDFIHGILNAGGYSSKSCFEVQLSNAMSNFICPEIILSQTSRQIGLIATKLYSLNLAFAVAADGTFLKKFIDEFTHKFWSSRTPKSRIQYIKEQQARYCIEPNES